MLIQINEELEKELIQKDDKIIKLPFLQLYTFCTVCDIFSKYILISCVGRNGSGTAEDKTRRISNYDRVV
jgi:hypothetical protein